MRVDFLGSWLLAIALLSGCNVYDPALVAGSGGASGVSGGSGAGGNGGTGGGGTSGTSGTSGDGGTGGACVPTGIEICDGQDNDCSGTADDGDAHLSCVSTVLNATSRCLPGGVCLFQRCLPGFYNCNANPGDGCERSEANVACGQCNRVCDDAGAEDAGPDGGDDGGVDAGVDAGPCTPVAEVCDGVDNDCDGTVDQGMTCPAGCTGATIAGRVYMVCSSSLSWGGARSACRAPPHVMALARVDDAAENIAIRSLATQVLGNPGDAWIGGNDVAVEGEWRWVEGSQLSGPPFWMGDASGAPVGGSYANWASGQPGGGTDQSCAAMTGDGTWDDRPCGTAASLPYVCEK